MLNSEAFPALKGQGLETNDAGMPSGQSLAPSGPKAGPEGEHGSRAMSGECGPEMWTLIPAHRRRVPLSTLQTHLSPALSTQDRKE